MKGKKKKKTGGGEETRKTRQGKKKMKQGEIIRAASVDESRSHPPTLRLVTVEIQIRMFPLLFC